MLANIFPAAFRPRSDRFATVHRYPAWHQHRLAGSARLSRTRVPNELNAASTRLRAAVHQVQVPPPSVLLTTYVRGCRTLPCTRIAQSDGRATKLVGNDGGAVLIHVDRSECISLFRPTIGVHHCERREGQNRPMVHPRRPALAASYTILLPMDNDSHVEASRPGLDIRRTRAHRFGDTSWWIGGI
jgi:hypothetical protein